MSAKTGAQKEDNAEPIHDTQPNRDRQDSDERAPDYDEERPADTNQDDDGEERSESPSMTPSEQERHDIAELEKTLPRPDWYTSDEDDSDVSSEEVVEHTEMTKKQEGGFVRLILYTVFCFVAFAFSLPSSCTIPWMRAKHSGRTYGVWRAQGGGEPDVKVNNIHHCSQEMQYWQAIAAFSVAATVLIFGALISGICICCGKGHIGVSMVLAFYGMVFALVSWSLVTTLFNYNRCGHGKYSSFANLNAGFALTLLAFVFMLAALIVMALQFFAYYAKSVHAGIQSPMRFFYLVLACISILFTCVGPAMTQWSRNFPLVKCKVTMWHTEIYDKSNKLSVYLGRSEYMCSTFTRRMKVVAAFNIMGNIWMYFSLLIGMAACFNVKLLTYTNFFGICAAVFMLVSWIVLLVIRHSHLCTTVVKEGESIWHDMGYNGIPSGVKNAQIEFHGYSMKEGFALIVTGWALNVVAVVLNCIF